MKNVQLFELSVQMAAFIVTKQAGKTLRCHATLGIALANYCNKAAILN
jgi:hypothetical protein